MAGKPIDEAVRAQFEAWAVRFGYSQGAMARAKDRSHAYANGYVEEMWAAWQAALTAAQQQGQAEGCQWAHEVVVRGQSAATSSGVGCAATGGRCNPGTTPDCPPALQPTQQGGGEVRIPSAAEWCDENSAEATMEWRAGWDACRVEYPRTAPPSAPDRDAYEGAREDLLDWKRRAQRAEATLRSLGYKGIDASEPPSAPVGVEAKAHALADELWLAYEQEDDLKAGMAYADACGRVRTLAAAIAQQPAAVDGVLAAVRAEVVRATAKFPTWPTDPLHASGVVQEESGELAKAVLQAVYEPHKSNPEDVAAEAVQTAAMAVRFLLSMDRYQWQRGEQHAQNALAAQHQEPKS
jgi:NTP pyrophosphatase (non-canonical NTP hydrolase)